LIRRNPANVMTMRENYAEIAKSELTIAARAGFK
jgi:hypothetical protein